MDVILDNLEKLFRIRFLKSNAYVIAGSISYSRRIGRYPPIRRIFYPRIVVVVALLLLLRRLVSAFYNSGTNYRNFTYVALYVGTYLAFVRVAY